ncbi:MAG: MFS transporter [Hyphomicrobiaceae bacterium]|nr:MFS transporter [Hyphomicrobiaceae bacterium]
MAAQGQEVPAAAPSTRGLVSLLSLVTGVQALATFSVLTLPTLATLAAPHFGVGAEAIGYQISVVYAAAAMLSSVAGLHVRRHGAAAMSILAMALSSAGLVGIATGNVAIAIVASASIGAAYGLTNPAASHLLFRFAPRHRQNLVFALKQTGVPLGGMLAALLLPPLASRYGWQAATALSAALMALVAVPLAASRGRLDDDRDPAARLGPGGVLSGMRLVLETPILRALALMGFAYASSQFCLFTFLITMLVKDLGWGLVAAGAAASVMQVGGVIGRIAWSLLADWIGRGVGVLIAIGLGSAGFAIVLAGATPEWPAWLMGVIVLGFGFCLVGWNGLWLAEVARAAGPGEVSLATGGVLAFTFGGIVLGPATFATIYRGLGSYALTYGVFSIYTVAGAVILALAARRQSGGGAVVGKRPEGSG